MVDESGGSKQVSVEGLPGVLPAECADGAVGCFGAGLHDFAELEELGRVVMWGLVA